MNLVACAVHPTIPLSTSVADDNFKKDPIHPLKIAIVQVPTDARIEKLKSISSEAPPKEKELEQAAINEKLRQAQNHAEAVFTDQLAKKPGLIVLQDTAVSESSRSLNLANNDEKLSLDVLKEFKKSTQADGVLRFRITDYGATPQKYLKWVYIGTGIWIATIVTLAATNPETRPYIGAYLGTEALQEGAELFLGISLFDWWYKPVRIEAELIDTNTGRILWQDAKTKTASDEKLKAYRKEEQKLREVQLAAATDRALDALLESLTQTIGWKLPG
ncbi:MAG: hypothetical protein ACYDBV_01000 [Nitrospiria bacterium]